MCRLCRDVREQIKAGIDEAGRKEAVKVIGEAIGASERTAEHFDPLLDELLDTKMPERDLAAEKVFENRKRHNNG